MNNYKKNIIWVKASIIAVLWASAEIVFGSYFHNLRIPFSGNILTSIGVIILMIFSQRWDEKGIFWRAGIITALLKTISPSAVIIGPMIAIFMQSVIFDFTLRIFGKNLFIYIFIAILMMIWNFIQKILVLVFYYGEDLITVYESTTREIFNLISLETTSIYFPLLMLFLIYLLFGIFTGLAGIKIARNLKINSTIVKEKVLNEDKLFSKNEIFPFSFYWMLFNLFSVVSLIVIIESSVLLLSLPLSLFIIFVWIRRYRSAIRQLLKPKLWITFLILTFLTSLVFQSSDGYLKGFVIGVNMNLRAMIIILGLTVIGKELYNPRLKKYFFGTKYFNIYRAVHISAKFLPAMIHNVPSFKTLINNPAKEFARLIELSLNLQKAYLNSKIFIISGERNSGKTSLVKNIARHLTNQNINVAGIYSEKVILNGIHLGYDVFDIQDRKKHQFLRTKSGKSGKKIGRYFIDQEGLNAGKKILSDGNQNDVIIIDEVGKLELKDDGWNNEVNKLLNIDYQNLIICVGNKNLEMVLDKYDLWNVNIINSSTPVKDFIKMFYENKQIPAL